MRFSLVVATLVAGTLTVPAVEAAVGPFGVVDLDYVALPTFEITAHGLPAKHLTFTQGRVAGFKNVVRPLRSCYGGVLCDFSVSGLRFTYKAVDTETDQEFSVVVDVLHGLLSVEREKNADEEYKVKEVHVKTLHQYVREPVEFSNDRAQNDQFAGKLRKKSSEFLENVARMDEFLRLFEKA